MPITPNRDEYESEDLLFPEPPSPNNEPIRRGETEESTQRIEIGLNSIRYISNHRPLRINYAEQGFQGMSTYSYVQPEPPEPVSPQEQFETMQARRLRNESKESERLRKVEEKNANRGLTLQKKFMNVMFVNDSKRQECESVLLKYYVHNSSGRQITPPNYQEKICKVYPNRMSVKSLEKEMERSLHELIENQMKIKCSACKKGMTQYESMQKVGAKSYCEFCYYTEFFSCHSCGSSHCLENKSVYMGHEKLCTICAKSATACIACGNRTSSIRSGGRNIKVEGKNEAICNACFLNPRICTDGEEQIKIDEKRWKMQVSMNGTDSIIMRGPDVMSTIYQDEEKGSIISTLRKFSAEIETIATRSDEKSYTLNQLIPKHVGVSNDGSLTYGGIEVQTPILQGKSGEDLIKKICSDLISNSFVTDISCGLHIHLDGGSKFTRIHRRTGNAMPLKSLWMFYIAFEEVIMSFLPSDRRGNRYCRPVRDGFSLDIIEATSNLAELERAWYKVSSMYSVQNEKQRSRPDSRYCGVNLHSLLRDNHLEIRYHSGTNNATKILEWVMLHATIMDKAEAGELSIENIRESRKHTTLPDLTEYFFSLLKLPEHTEKYLRKRQSKFSGRAKSNENDLTEKEICAA